jgi:beta-glucosidase
LAAAVSARPAAAGEAAADEAIAARAETLLGSMTLDEKVGQMTQVDRDAMHDKADIAKYFLGSMLSGGNSNPPDISAKGWARMHDEYQAWAMKTRLKIPLIYGIDAVHGNNHIPSAVVFPHNVGLGATRNPKLVEQAGRVAAAEVACTGIRWTFAPCIAVPRNIRWGRTYEGFGELPELAVLLGPAAVRGMQGQAPSPTSVLACAKHFLGDGGTTGGKDQGNTECDEATLRKIHLPGYAACVRAGVGSIMVSYSSWNGKKMHGNKYLLTDVLKKELGFQGFLISDWAAIDQLSADYKSDIEKSINAGLDMIMIPNGPGQKNNYIDFIRFLKELVAEGRVPQSRIDDAVGRILRVKLRAGLFEQPFSNAALLAAVGSPEHRRVARECVRQSLVLLKNDKRALPLSKEATRLLVLGKAADDMGIQCGGWTIDWQGKPGKVLKGGTTILEGIRRAVPGAEVVFAASAPPKGDSPIFATTLRVVPAKIGTVPKQADAVIVVVGELPYAEGPGDRTDLSLSPQDVALVKQARQSGTPVITILISGRPMLIGPALEASDAFLAAWLPGSEGQGVADVLFGDYKPTGKLPHTWPRSMAQVPCHVGEPAAAKALFPYGFGLTW